METKANKDVRQKARAEGIPWWRIGQAVGVSEITIIRWLRTPLPAEKEKLICDAIESIKRAEAGI